MADLEHIVRMLERQRRELVDQLAAVDKAIAALNGTAADRHARHQTQAGGDARRAPPDIPTEDPPATTLPRRVKPKRVLSDAHKQAMMAGRRKARDAYDVAAGLAREMPDEDFVPAIGGRGDRQEPRLITKAIKK
jgi:hypothetical protein